MLDIVKDNEIYCKIDPGDYSVSKLLWIQTRSSKLRKGVHPKVVDQHGL